MRKNNKFDAMRGDAIDRILSAATRLFSQYGYSATTIQMIADAAGVVPSGIYHYYSGKQELLAAVVLRLRQELEGSISQTLELHFQQHDIFSFLDFCCEKLRENISEVRLLCMLLMQKDTPRECVEKFAIIPLICTRLSKYLLYQEDMQRATPIVEDMISIVTLYAIAQNEEVLERQMQRLKNVIRVSYAGRLGSIVPTGKIAD